VIDVSLPYSYGGVCWYICCNIDCSVVSVVVACIGVVVVGLSVGLEVDVDVDVGLDVGKYVGYIDGRLVVVDGSGGIELMSLHSSYILAHDQSLDAILHEISYASPQTIFPSCVRPKEPVYCISTSFHPFIAYIITPTPGYGVGDLDGWFVGGRVGIDDGDGVG